MNKFTRWAVIFASTLLSYNTQALPNHDKVRLAIVNAPAESGFIQYLTDDFTEQTGYQLDIIHGSDVYEMAKSGQADVVISHYGRTDLKNFVQQDFGSWPTMVFASQSVLIGPVTDPAGIYPLTRLADSIQHIADSDAPYISNALEVIKRTTELGWQLAGQPDKSDWFVEEDAAKEQAAELANALDGYYLWGAWPFIKYQQQHHLLQKIVLTQDPLLQRMMSATIVNPAKIQDVNAIGAEALVTYLTQPQVQAKIAQFQMPYTTAQLWWPATLHN